MKHCKNCEKCTLDLVSLYVHGTTYYKCAKDGHYISEPFWEKCNEYKKDDVRHNNGSFLYELVRKLRE